MERTCKTCGEKTSNMKTQQKCYSCWKQEKFDKKKQYRQNTAKKQTKVRKTKKSEKTKLRKEAVKKAKDIAKKRDNYTCLACGRKTNIHGSHIIPEGKDGRLSYDPDNIKALCSHCHLSRWHKNPVEAGNWFYNTYPERREKIKNKHLENKKKKTIKEWEIQEKIDEMDNLDK